MRALERASFGSRDREPIETTWRLLGSGSKSWWAWSVCSPDAVVYQISPTRSAKDAGRILRDFSGVVVADGYSAYKTLRNERVAARAGPAFELAACWAHVRRKFLEAEPNHPEATSIIELIRELYAVEAEGRAAPERLAVLRGEKSRELVDQLRDALLAIRASALFARHGRLLHLRALVRAYPLPRRFAYPARQQPHRAGSSRHRDRRKNHYGSRSLRATKVAALFYSLNRVREIVRRRAPRLPPRGNSQGNRSARCCHRAPSPARTLAGYGKTHCSDQW